ncbi:MAG: AI-2E family transporter [Pirellulales bacterium]
MAVASTESTAQGLRRSLTVTLTVAAVVLAFGLAYLLRAPVFYLFIGIVLATAMRPPIGWLNRAVSRPTAVGIVYGVVAVLLMALAVVGVPLLVVQAEQFMLDLPKQYESLRGWLDKIDNETLHQLVDRMPKTWDEVAKSTSVGSWSTSASEAISFGGGLLRALLALFFTMLLAFYWSLHDDRTVRALVLMLPAEKREDARTLVDMMQNKVGAYLRGQAILCLAVGSLSLVAFLLIGLPYALVLAVVAGMLEAVPLLGPALGAVPALFVALSSDPQDALWVMGAAFGIQQIENYVLVPRVMDRSVGVNAVVTLLAIAAFGTLFGLAGAVLAIPLAAILQVLLEHFILRPEALAPEAPTARDARGRLQYEAQQLITDLRLEVREKDDDLSDRSDRVEEELERLAVDLGRLLERPAAAATVAGSAAP